MIIFGPLGIIFSVYWNGYGSIWLQVLATSNPNQVQAGPDEHLP